MNALYTVVVADDEDELREAVCTMIPWQELGFRLAGSASNGLDALQLVEEHQPDLLLTDIRMPFISGIELARQVRQVRPMTHIAFLSGYDDFEYAKQAIQYNIISYMLKPLTVKGLVEELKIIRRKIDAQFADFRQEAPQEAGLDERDVLPTFWPVSRWERFFRDAFAVRTAREMDCAVEAWKRWYRAASPAARKDPTAKWDIGREVAIAMIVGTVG